MVIMLALWAGAAGALVKAPPVPMAACAVIAAASLYIGRRSLLAGVMLAASIGTFRAAITESNRVSAIAAQKEGPLRAWVHVQGNGDPHNGRVRFPVEIATVHLIASSPEMARAGEEWLVEGEVRAFAGPAWQDDSDAQEIESRRGFLAAFHIDSILERREAPTLEDRLARARRAAALRLQRLPGGAVAASIVTGDRGGLAASEEAAFRRGGIVHILSVSGLHLSAAALVFFFVLRMLLGVFVVWWPFSPRKWAALASLVPMGIYCVFTGAELPAVRSALMTATVMLAMVFGTRVSGRAALSLALGVCTLVWPEAVLEPTFLFSFGSVLTLIVWAPRWSPPQAWWSLPVGLFVSSILATLFSWPLSAHFFHRIALGGLWNNLWCVPLTSIALTPLGLLWLGLCLCGLRVGGLEELLAYGGRLLLSAGKLAPPEVAFSLTSVEATLLVIAVALCLARVSVWRRPAALISFIAALMTAEPWVERHRSKDLIAHFLPIGQGDGAALFAPGGAVWLVDGGGDPAGHWDPGERIVVPFLLSKRVFVIDDVIVTHAHPDHFAGLLSVVSSLSVRRLWWTGHGRTELAPLLDLATQRGVELHTFDDLPMLPHASVEKLHPNPSPDEAFFPEFGFNDNSVVLRIGFFGRHLLLTGDIEKLAEDWLLGEARGRLLADVLKVPHHGSNTSSTAAFLKAVQPTECVISVGLHNKFGHPHRAVLQRLLPCRIWRTDEQGLVSVRFSPSGEPPAVMAFSAAREPGMQIPGGEGLLQGQAR